MKNFGPDYSVTIRAGRAYVRLIEAAGVLAEWEDDDRSRRKWQRVRRQTQERLRKLVEVLPPHVTAEIMAASEKLLGPIQDRMWGGTSLLRSDRVIALLALVLFSTSCGAPNRTSGKTENASPVAELLLTTADLGQLRQGLWTESPQPTKLPNPDGSICGDECAARSWSAPGGDLVLTLNRHPTARAAGAGYDQAVQFARDRLGYEPAASAAEVQLPEHTWLGSAADGPVRFYLYTQRGPCLVVILLVTKYATVSDEQLQSFELILSDVALAQLAKLPGE